MSEAPTEHESLPAAVSVEEAVEGWGFRIDPSRQERNEAREALAHLIEAVEAAHSYNFEAHGAGDIKPYRRLQAAMKALGLETDV